MTDCLDTTKLSRRSILGALAVASGAGAAGVTLAGQAQDPLEYHLAEAVKLLRARDPSFQWDIFNFNGSRGRTQIVTLSGWRVDP
ncbi:hypothetical protein [Mesorhizobium sp. Root695]|uniref:hypothetical protein n=1 Tax=Mesorhizobium sp. Root695 TaxID=1736589 RepID=UPI000AC812F7|nr:hypothetical protein [Mesorhizobium sp. Root695]